MLSPRWRKVARDLLHQKTRTVLVVLSIAIGVFAVGMILHTSVLVARQVEEDYARSRAANATVYAAAIDEEMLDVIRHMPEVEDAQGRVGLTVRVQVAPDEWKPLSLRAFEDLEDIRIDRVLPVDSFEPDPAIGAERGSWPPEDQEVTIERASFLMPGMMPADAVVGEKILVETTDGTQRQLRLSGLAHEPNAAPATFIGQAVGYINFDTLEWLGRERLYDRVTIVVRGDATDTDHILAVAQEVEDKLEKSGREVYAKEIHEPGETPRDTILQGMTGLMFPLGLMSLLLSGFLVVNTISALLSQHVRQIGIMKAVGARNGQIFAMYMVLVAIFCTLALLIAVPLAALATTQTADLLAGFLNTTFPPYSLPPEVLAIEIIIGLIVPMLAALYPVISGIRVSVQEAVSDYGVGQGTFGTHFMDRILGHVRGLSRPLLLSLRNTFRRRGRLVLTLFTLILGGAIFIAVTNVRGSLLLTLDDALQYWRYDVSISFARTYRLEQIEHIARSVPGVTDVESWDFSALRRVRPDGSESDNIFVGALPADTVMLEPSLIKGRWLLPGDENAIVVNQEVLKNEPDVDVGDSINLKIDDRETAWQIVGVVRVIGTENWAYVNYDYYTRTAHETGRASQVQVLTDRHDGESVALVSQSLQNAYKSAGLQTTSAQTVVEIREQNEFYFGIIVTLLLIMSVLIAAVGALGLTGTMSINVLERTREIGVMRAIGASNGAVRRIVLVEGLLIGLLSWILGALLAFPLGRVMSDGVGYAFFRMPLSYAFSTDGIVIWLVIVTVLSAIASIVPARNASRLTVRETLAYE
jgi:putative ABC transport system permease protein